MNCSRFKSQLQARIEQHLPLSTSDDGFREHLSNCTDPACRRAWLDACLLEQAITEWAAGFPQPDLADRVIRELRSPAGAPATPTPAVRVVRRPAPVRPDARSPARWIVVPAALLVLISVVAILMSPQPPVAPQDVSVAESGTSPGPDVAPPAPEDPVTPLDPPLPEAELSSAYLSFAEDATHFLTDTVALTLAGEDEIEDPTAAADWIHGMQDRLGPLGEDFDAALDEFLQTIPDSDT